MNIIHPANNINLAAFVHFTEYGTPAFDVFNGHGDILIGYFLRQC